MKNALTHWRTTLCGLIAALPVILHVFGINFNPELGQVLTAVGSLALGANASDAANQK